MAYWSDLPPELLDIVTTQFDVPSDDLRHFRSVCSMWRSAVPKPLPTQFPPMKFFNSNNNFHQYDIRLIKHSFYHLSLLSNPDLPGWLIKIEENNPGTVSLFHPFSRSQIKVPLNFPKQLDLTNIRIRELDYEYVLRNVSGNVELYNMEHEKVAIVTSSNSNNSDEIVILSTHITGKLLMYRSNVQVWSFLDDLVLGYDDRSVYVNDWCMHYVDVKEFNGTFYAVTNSGRTVSIQVMNGLSTVHVTLLKNSIIGGDKKSLVKLGDDLLMIDLYTDTTPRGMVKVHAVEIFRLDSDNQKWVLVKSLGDYAIFLSNHSTFSAIALRGCKGNCIYFQFSNFGDKNKCCSDIVRQGKREEMDDFEWKSEEIGVFDFEKGVVGRLEEYMENSHLFSWPPPTWVISAKQNF
ncbi:hypothetical protein RND81_09G147800 [Saponaria officinalis]|uniref:Uncharacterized protein n=1 Tax=Saponaria officinalis TaxID=3572 RepID=A0AAW1IMX4_SAPOF